MSIDLLLSIAQLIGIIAVVASVAFLALETRTTARGQDLNAYSVAVNLMVQPIADMKRDPELINLYMRGLEDFDSLSTDDKWRFGAMMQEFCWGFHAFWTWDELQSLSEADAKLRRDDMPSLRAIIARPGFRAWWIKGRNVMPGNFTAYVDELVALNEQHGAPRIGNRREWRRAAPPTHDTEGTTQ